MDEELAASAAEVTEFCRLLFDRDDDLGGETEFHEDEDCEGPFESLLRHASELEAGLMPGWKLDRTHPGVLLWTTPSGRQYKSTPDGCSRLVLGFLANELAFAKSSANFRETGQSGVPSQPLCRTEPAN